VALRSPWDNLAHLAPAILARLKERNCLLFRLYADGKPLVEGGVVASLEALLLWAERGAERHPLAREVRVAGMRPLVGGGAEELPIVYLFPSQSPPEPPPGLDGTKRERPNLFAEALAEALFLPEEAYWMAWEDERGRHRVLVPKGNLAAYLEWAARSLPEPRALEVQDFRGNALFRLEKEVERA